MNSSALNCWKVSIEDELGRNNKLKQQDITLIREWLLKQPHLPQNISDNQITLFIHAGDYRVQEAKTLIENYYTLRTKFTQFFTERNSLHPYIQQMISVSACVVYGKDYSKRTVMWTKLLNTEPAKYYPTTATKVMFMISDIDQLENGIIPGYTMVLDGKDFSVQHAMRCSFSNARNIITYVQTASTVIIEKVIMINMTPAAEKVMILLKPFINSELFNKITVCPNGNYDEVFKTIPKEVIPKDYNGDAPSITNLNDIWRKKLESYADWFVEEEKLRVYETKRISDSLIKTDTKFGIEGSFKTLALD